VVHVAYTATLGTTSPQHTQRHTHTHTHTHTQHENGTTKHKEGDYLFLDQTLRLSGDSVLVSAGARQGYRLQQATVNEVNECVGKGRKMRSRKRNPRDGPCVRQRKRERRGMETTRGIDDWLC